MSREQTLEQWVLESERENSAPRKDKQKAENALVKEKSLWKSVYAQDKVYRKNPMLMHMIEVAEHILSNPKKILQNTGCMRDQFDALLLPVRRPVTGSTKALLFRSGRTPHAPGE